MSEMKEICFNCQRDENEIPIIAWKYQKRPLWVCCECMPLLIHKWSQIVGRVGSSESQSANVTLHID